MKQPAVYLLASKPYGTIYVGVTSNLIGRTWQHQNALADGFSKRYHVHSLVWYKQHESMLTAIEREKHIKKWKRDWKVNLIQIMNPEWRDLSVDFTA